MGRGERTGRSLWQVAKLLTGTLTVLDLPPTEKEETLKTGKEKDKQLVFLREHAIECPH